MSQLDRDIRAADEMGISYGYYIALSYDPYQAMAAPERKKKRGPARKFSDEQAFALWKRGKNDTAIAVELDVSQQTITNWRRTLELPHLSQSRANPTKYRLAYLPDGTCVAVHIDEI